MIFPLVKKQQTYGVHIFSICIPCSLLIPISSILACDLEANSNTDAGGVGCDNGGGEPSGEAVEKG